jgi:glycosyltransferase involved in cell wall biosynthesis
VSPARPAVAILHYSAPPTIGGVELVIAEHARLLAEAGYPLTIVAGRGDAEGLPGVPMRLVPEIDSEYPPNLEISQALAEGGLPPAFDVLAGRIEQTLAATLSGTEIVIVHNVLTMHFNLPLAAALRRLQAGAGWRLVAWCHDISRYAQPGSGSDRRKGYPWDLLRTYDPETTYVAVSQERRRQLSAALEVAPEKILVVPNGVDPASLLGLSDLGRRLLKDYDLLAAGLVLLMPVRMTRAKNIEFALRLTARLKALGARPRLVVTGPPDPHVPDALDFFEELRALRRELGLAREAFFVYEGTAQTPGPLELETPVVGELYRLCDAVLMPSRREGFGIPVLEAGLAGRPVFVTPVPAVEEVGADAVHLIARGEPAEQAAERLWAWAEQDPEQRLRRRVRQGYTWQSIFRERIEPLLASARAAARAGGAA